MSNLYRIKCRLGFCERKGCLRRGKQRLSLERVFGGNVNLKSVVCKKHASELAEYLIKMGLKVVYKVD